MEHYRAVLYVQVAADLLTCWLASALAGRLFGSRAALVVLWLAALCPFTANYVAAPLTETLVAASIALAFYGFARWQDAGCGYNRWLWVTAAALAWSILLRPEQVLFAAAVLPAMLWGALAARDGAGTPRVLCVAGTAAALCVALPLVPWTTRNWRTFHVFQPLAPRYANDPGELRPLGFSRWYRTWAIEFASTERSTGTTAANRIAAQPTLPERAFDAGLARGVRGPAQSHRCPARRLQRHHDVTTDSHPEIDPASTRSAGSASARIRCSTISACPSPACST